MDFSQRKIVYEKIYGLGVFITTKPITLTSSYLIQDKPIELEEIGIATGLTVATYAGIISPIFYLVDVFKDLVGHTPIEETRQRRREEGKISKYQFIRKKTEAFENWLKEQTQEKKKNVAYGIIAGGIALTATLYSLFPTNDKKIENHKYDTIKISTNYSENNINNNEIPRK